MSATGAGGSGSGGATVTSSSGAGQAGTSSAGGAACSVVTTDDLANDCTPFATSCDAPPTAQRAFGPIASWVSDHSALTLMVGADKSFFAGAYFKQGMDEAWQVKLSCQKPLRFIPVGIDDETVIQLYPRGDGPAASSQVLINGVALLDFPNTPAFSSLSGDTLLADNQVFERAGGAWNRVLPDISWNDGTIWGLGADRFSYQTASTTELIRRDGASWMSLGSLPAARSVAMSAASAATQRVAISTATGASLYQAGQAGWSLEKTFTGGYSPSLGMAADGEQFLVMPGRDALHVFGASSDWAELDTIPFQGAGALAIGNRILVVTTNPKDLEGVSPLRADDPAETRVVVYERAQ